MLKKRTFSLSAIFKAAVLAAVLAVFILSLARLDDSGSEAHRRQLEESIRRACVVCYSTEGFYPPDVAYLEQRYGVQTDPDRYTVFYDIFAENIMPEITVVSKSK